MDKENQKIIIKDLYREVLRDGDVRPNPVKGVVVIKQDGKTILKKNNLVVKSGRSVIFNLLLEYIGKTTGESNEHSVGYIISSGTNVPSDGDTLSSFSNGATLGIIEDGNIETNNEELYLKFKITLNGSGLTAVSMSELGLFIWSHTVDEKWSEEELDKDKYNLFSRIVFDPLPLTSGNKFDLEYYLYF